ncbi:MAG TPA: SH3 domain-containing protein [Magnetospirillum sp.]|nr:SH3 domain-containing protein [Magnetospirillum sp.]
MRATHGMALAAVLGLSACVPDKMGQPPVTNSNINMGQNAYVACSNMPLHAQPSGFSPVLGTLAYGASVKALDYAGIYQMPESQQDKTANNADTRISTSMKNMGAAWVKVNADGTVGYAANSCLVDRALLDRQDPSGRARAATGQTARRFTEDERGDQRVNRGGLGVAAACSGPNCSNTDAVDKLIQSTPSSNPFVDDAAFRQAGRLGEFK